MEWQAMAGMIMKMLDPKRKEETDETVTPGSFK